MNLMNRIHKTTVITLCAIAAAVCAFSQNRYTEEERKAILDYESCFPSLSKPEPHKKTHQFTGGITVTTIDRTDYANHRFVTADHDKSNLNIALVDKSGLKCSDDDIESILNDQFATGPGFHLNAHGVTDNNGMSTGILMDGKILDAGQTARLILDTLDDFQTILDAKGETFPIVLHTCESAKGGNDSFAAELSRILTKHIENAVVVAADATVMTHFYTDGRYDERVESRSGKWTLFKNGTAYEGSTSYKKSMDISKSL